MGWFGDQLLSQKPRKSGCICTLFLVLSWSTCMGLSLWQYHRWGWI